MNYINLNKNISLKYKNYLFIKILVIAAILIFSSSCFGADKNIKFCSPGLAKGKLIIISDVTGRLSIKEIDCP